jgi:hypothetical protein
MNMVVDRMKCTNLVKRDESIGCDIWYQEGIGMAVARKGTASDGRNNGRMVLLIFQAAASRPVQNSGGTA